VGTVRGFIEEEFAGVQGVRCEEFFLRAEEAGMDRGAVEEAVEKFPVRLRKHKTPEGHHYEWKPWAQLEADEAITRLLGYPEWGGFFVDLCGNLGQFRAQVWQFRDELSDRGAELEHSEVEDALFELAARELPDTPVGECDPREILFKQAVTWLMENQPDRWSEFTEGLDELWYSPLGEFREELRERMKVAAREVAA